MRIDKNNYEAYFIDYYEGNLSKEVGEELFEFLARNPELREEFLAFEAFTYKREDEKFQLKNSLKKEVSDLGKVTPLNIDEYCVAFLEDDLSARDKNRFIDQVYGNAQFEETFRLYQLTQLKPDESRRFTLKAKMKRFTLNRKVILRMSGIAAAAAVLVILIFRYNPATEVPKNIEKTLQVAEKVELPQPIEKPEINKVQPLQIPTERLVGSLKTNTQPTERTEQPVQLAVVDSIREPIRIAMKTMQLKTPDRLENPFKTELTSAESSIPVIQLAEVNRQAIESTPVTQAEDTQTLNETEPNRFNLMTLAEVGIRMFSKLNERNIEVKPHYDESGDLESVTLITNRRTITTPAI